jgi:hypothetical protein
VQGEGRERKGEGEERGGRGQGRERKWEGGEMGGSGKRRLNWGSIIINIKIPLQRSFPCANMKFHPTKYIETTLKV